jgi:Gas vesicle synthesis protein GvpL/GvpF
MAEAEGPVYVYGILAASGEAAAPVAGVDGAPVRAITEGRLAALVSDLEAGALAVAREVRAHWRVLEAASDQGTTVIPVRFGTVMESEQAVRDELLTPQQEHLTALLGDLSGRVQLSVKGRYDEERLMRDVVHRTPKIAALRERVRALSPQAGYYQRISLGEMVAAAVDQRREDDLRLVLDRLEPLAVRSRAEAPSGEDGAFDIAFLVERERLPEFSDGVAAVGAALDGRVAVRYVGPLPPYSFIDDPLAAGVA